MASYEPGSLRGGPVALAYDSLQQTHSGGQRLAQEFEAKTNLKGAAQKSCSPRSGRLQDPLPAKQPRGRTQDLRVNTTWQDSWHPHDSASPLINASYPSSLGGGDSPEKHGSNRTSFSRQHSEEPPLKRQYSDSSDSSRGGAGGGKSRRSSLAASPIKDRKGRDWVISTADGGQSVEPDGLHFLLKTCELLDPGMAKSREEGPKEEELQASPKRVAPRVSRQRRPPSQPQSPPSQGRRYASDPQHPPQQQQQQRAQRPSGEVAYFKPEDDSEDEYMQDHDDYVPAAGASDSDEDYEYVPRKAPGKAARATRAAARAAAGAAPGAAGAPRPQPPAPRQHVEAAPEEPLPSSSPCHPAGAAGSMGGGASSQEEAATLATAGGAGARAMVAGPCMNPDCEHPYDSPQWRKGPPNAPVLCNACGTRWLRNGTLKPLVPRRGIRYKNKPRTVSAPPTGKAAKAAAAAASAVQREQPAQQTERAPQQGRRAAAPAAEQAVADLHAGAHPSQQAERQASTRMSEVHAAAGPSHDEQYRQYCQLVAALGAGEGAGAGSAAAQALGPAALTLLNPALLTALFGGQVGNMGGASAWQPQQQQQAAGVVAPAWQPAEAHKAASRKVGTPRGQAGGAKAAPPVFQLQAMASGHVMGPMFLAAAPSSLFQQQ